MQSKIMTTTPSKNLKRMVREWANRAHDEELHRALAELANSLKQWKDGALDSAALNDLIHRFHQGAARDIYLRYATNQLEAPLAHAIVTGVLDKKSVPPELLQHLTRQIEFYEQK